MTVSYFDHNAQRTRQSVSWELVEYEPIVVTESRDPDEVERARQMWQERVNDVPNG